MKFLNFISPKKLTSSINFQNFLEKSERQFYIVLSSIKHWHFLVKIQYEFIENSVGYRTINALYFVIANFMNEIQCKHPFSPLFHLFLCNWNKMKHFFCRFQKIFPTPDTHIYLQYFSCPKYYNLLFDAWETKHHNNREEGTSKL